MGRLELEHFLDALPPDGPVLDLGAGYGQWAIPIARTGREVIAVERDEEHIQRLRAEAPPNLRVVRADVRTVVMEGHYAGVVLSHVAQFLSRSQVKELIARIEQHVQPGGAMWLRTFSPEDPMHRGLVLHGVEAPSDPGTYINDDGETFSFWTVEELIALLEGWNPLQAQQVLAEDEHPPGGRHLHGTSEVLARRIPGAALEQEPVRGPEPQALPSLGVGFGMRNVFARDALELRDGYDCLELITEEVLEDFETIDRWKSVAPLVMHGVTLNLGGASGISDRKLADIAQALHRSGAPWHSDHLCMVATDMHNTCSLAPLPFCEEAVDTVSKNVACFRKHTNVPLLVENITYMFSVPEPEMDEGAFLTAVVERADLGIMLDVCNVVINATNHGYDPVQFLETIPLDRVVQLHLAGGERHGRIFYDTHNRAVADDTWRVYEEVLKRAPVKAVILERDADHPPLPELLEEVAHARDLFRRHRG